MDLNRKKFEKGKNNNKHERKILRTNLKFDRQKNKGTYVLFSGLHTYLLYKNLLIA